MFLALTAETGYWEKDGKILCLGSWCLRHDRPADWRGLDIEVLETPWRDRPRFYAAAEYVDELGERTLAALAPALNEIHGLDRSRRYWRVVVGPWLMHLLHASYDRVVHLRAATARCADWTTRLPAESWRPPSDTLEFVDAVTGDEGNMRLIADILRLSGRRFPEIRPPEPSTVPVRGSGWPRILSSGVRSLLARFVGECARRAAAGRPWVFELHLRPKYYLALLLSGGVRPLPRPPAPAPAAISRALRLRLAGMVKTSVGGGADPEFEAIVPGLIEHFFPLHALEAFSALRASVGEPSSRAPIASAVGWYFEEGFKVHAAEAGEKGAPLISVQHGGGYGQYLFSAPERHEARISDRYFVWGWARQNPGKFVDIPHPQLLAQTATKAAGDAPALFVPTEHSRYLYRFHSTPVGSLWPDYFDAQRRFLAGIGADGRRELLFRTPKYLAGGQGQKERVSADFSDVAWDDGRHLDACFGACRLFVLDHLGTVLLEALGRNLPTLAFWTPDLWEIRPEAKEAFDRLREAGILFSTPEDAAKQYLSVIADPEKWWRSRPVQDARAAFAREFARSDPNWASIWSARMSEAAAP